MRIYLIGYSFSGKTTMGRQLANLLHYDFFDTDKAIELKLHTTIPLLFERYGEEAFRIIESNILRTTAERDNIVVSTGGGTACSDDNLRFILDNGIAVYLHMDLEGTLRRVAASRKKRPL
ncbi:MAG: shikimate kinase, partial [Bacteroidales bacterium]|nr:shikimate kinase [Bacteroidales bacterium]